MTTLPLLGGSAMIVGVLLPWMTFYAGLQRLNGLTGMYGRWLLAAGVVVVGLAAWSTWRRVQWPSIALVLVGLTCTVSAAVLLLRAQQMTETEAMLMLVPRLGPGLPLVLVGAAAGAAGGAIMQLRRRL